MSLSSPKKYALAVAFVGVFISGLVVFVERKMIAINAHNQPYIALGEYLKNISTKAHLWFEEAMSGDTSIVIDRDVYGYLDKSINTLEAALEGENTDIGKFYKTEDAEIIMLLKESIGDVQNLKSAAQRRWKYRQQTLQNESDTTLATAGEEAGGALDQEFDTSYEGLQHTYDRLVEHVKQQVTYDNAVLDKLSWASVVFVVLVFVVLSSLLYRMQLKNVIFQTANEEKLKEETGRISALSKFVQAISAGDYAAGLSINDELSLQLLSMRDTLKDNSENEKRRNWTSTGIAQMSEILRSGFEQSGELYDKIIQYIVKYSDSKLGLLFVVNDQDQNSQYLELVSAYAFDRKKFVQKRVELGEGQVGQCYLEGQTIYKTDIPQDYIAITSGLGGAAPSSLLIVPLMVNGKIFGILEMASFKAYQDDEIQFIEKLCESVASTISSLKVNQRTSSLLEQTQQQAEEMRAQEEEMRQNMEELSATQEEMLKKEQEYLRIIQSLQRTPARDLSEVLMASSGHTPDENLLDSRQHADGLDGAEFNPARVLEDQLGRIGKSDNGELSPVEQGELYVPDQPSASVK